MSDIRTMYFNASTTERITHMSNGTNAQSSVAELPAVPEEVAAMSPRGIPSWGPTKMNIFKKGLMAAMVVMFAALMFFLGVVSNNGQGSILTIGAVLLVFMIGYILWPPSLVRHRFPCRMISAM